MEDPYLTATHRWWHLSSASPELAEAETAGQLGDPGVAVDLGCGLGSELAYLVARGWRGVGVDLLTTPLSRARDLHPEVGFVQATVTGLPLRTGSADLLVDRGCFHYLDAYGRSLYASEAGRVLRVGGRLMLRMCLNSAGTPNGLDEATIRTTFESWRVTAMERMDLVTGTRTMLAVVALLLRPAVVPP